ncbi:gamma subclass chorismate mutase AroQ [Nocardia sp. NBC_00511]|uniref:gamma subclass chorismate mutase AroQ n=1 Tax=Nocardia sp. NBC_00511 TaxID=2903591 RepID=UPI0030DF343C
MKALAVAAVSSIMLLSGQAGQAAAAPPTDSLDQLVGLLAARIGTADTVAEIKWAAAQQDSSQPVIDDPAREATIYDAMTQLGAQHGLPETWVRQVFAGQIDASKLVQRGLVTVWESGVAHAPTPTTDLAGIRPVIDRLNTSIIDEMSDRRAELTGPGCAARVTASVVAVGARQPDDLHQAALIQAAVPLCD